MFDDENNNTPKKDEEEIEIKPEWMGELEKGGKIKKETRPKDSNKKTDSN